MALALTAVTLVLSTVIAYFGGKLSTYAKALGIWGNFATLCSQKMTTGPFFHTCRPKELKLKDKTQPLRGTPLRFDTQENNSIFG